MRIVIVTAGTGSFYCGTCMRDNALAVELRRLGHDAILLPLYLPPSLDEPTASDNVPLFYGGVNVYLQQTSGIFRKTPRWLDSMLDSPAVLKIAAGRAGSTKAEDLGPLTVSTLRGEDGNQAKELERLCDWLREDFKPDVVCLSNALLLGLAESIKEKTGAKVYCTLQGEDGFLDSLPSPYREEAWSLLSQAARRTDGLIAVSHYHADLMCDRASLPRSLVSVVYNGIRSDGFEPRASPPSPPVIGYLARMCEAKGLDDLVDAYIVLRQRASVSSVRLRVAGSMTEQDAGFVGELREKLKVAGVDRETEFLPNISREEKTAFLRSLSVLSVPATYGESFGLYLIEAWASGVPVVQPRHAVFPELIGLTGAGLLHQADDVKSLADTLEAVLSDSAGATEMGQRGRVAVEERFTAGAMARGVLEVFEGREALRRVAAGTG